MTDLLLQVLSRLSSPLPRVVSLRRGTGRRDVYVTTHVNLGEIPLLSRRPSPAISAATDVEEHLHHPGAEVRLGQHLHPQKQRLLSLDAGDYPPPSRDIAVSACSTSSICDDQLSPDTAAAAADNDDDDDDE